MAKQKEKQRHLGRGLESLLGPIILDQQSANQELPISTAPAYFPADRELQNSLRQIPIDAISPNPYQPRTSLDHQELADLAESIKTSGVIQPIIVRPAGTGYEMIAGERRLRAAQLASLTTIPALVREATEGQLLELALIENIHRTDLNPIEHAKAYQSYLNTFSLTQVEAAKRLGKNRSVIANYIRLLELPDEIQRMLIDGRLTTGHARAMLALPTDELRRKLANRAMAGRLSVREVERLVRRHLTATGQAERVACSKPAHILDLENKLTSQLGTKVKIETQKNQGRGRIIIEFYSLDEFDRIAQMIGLASSVEAV